jgi:hypothetical protein
LVSSWKRCSGSKTYRVFDVNTFLLLCQLFGSGDEFLEVLIGSFVILLDLDGCRIVDLVDRLSLLESGLIGIRQDTLVDTGSIGEVASSDV